LPDWASYQEVAEPWQAGGLGGGPLGGGQQGAKDLHSLVKTISDVKVAAKARALGREISYKELGIVVAQVLKYLSVTFIRTQSLFLLNRLCFFRVGARAAAGRRDLAKTGPLLVPIFGTMSLIRDI
jgi:hypothetical protein